MNQAGLGSTWPDLVIVLDVDPEAGLARQDGEDRIGGQGVLFQRQVARFYAELAATDSDRVVIVDGSGDVDDVARRVADLVRNRW